MEKISSYSANTTFYKRHIFLSISAINKQNNIIIVNITSRFNFVIITLLELLTVLTFCTIGHSVDSWDTVRRNKTHFIERKKNRKNVYFNQMWCYCVLNKSRLSPTYF